jgi:hypothetical protein
MKAQVATIVARHEAAEEIIDIKEPPASVDEALRPDVAMGASGEQSTESSDPRKKRVPLACDDPNNGKLSSVTIPPFYKDSYQPAGETSVSRVVEEAANVNEKPITTKPRSLSECTFTSYVALEGGLRDVFAYSENIDAEVDANGDSTKNGSTSKKSSIHTGSSENEDESPSPLLVHSDESGLSDDAQGGPPRVITTTSQGHSGRSSSPKSKNPLRRGKWTVEEEGYVARVIQDFNSGFLDAPAGTTLRTYLSEKLQCDPMRITKKFTGEACIGKRVFHPAVRSPSNASAIDKAQVSPTLGRLVYRLFLEMYLTLLDPLLRPSLRTWNEDGVGAWSYNNANPPRKPQQLPSLQVAV